MTTSGTFAALGHPHAQQADAAQAVHVDDVRRVGDQLGKPKLEVLSERHPNAGTRNAAMSRMLDHHDVMVGEVLVVDPLVEDVLPVVLEILSRHWTTRTCPGFLTL